MRAELAGSGGFLLVFGFLWLLLSYSITNAIYGYNGDAFQQLAIQLVGLILASLGAGLLAYAIASRAPGPQA
jgi:hypothetical protein